MARRVLLICCLAAAGCGGGSSSPSTPSTPSAPANPNTITITASGVSPKQLTVAPGSRVLFVNNDTRAHEMASDPHPDHQDCPPINSVGLLNPTQSRETTNLIDVRTCGFHDHQNPDNTSLKGQITVR